MTGRRSPSSMRFDQWYIVLGLDHSPLDRMDCSVANAEPPAILPGALRNAEWHQSYIGNRWVDIDKLVKITAKSPADIPELSQYICFLLI